MILTQGKADTQLPAGVLTATVLWDRTTISICSVSHTENLPSKIMKMDKNRRISPYYEASGLEESYFDANGTLYTLVASEDDRRNRHFPIFRVSEDLTSAKPFIYLENNYFMNSAFDPIQRSFLTIAPEAQEQVEFHEDTAAVMDPAKSMPPRTEPSTEVAPPESLRQNLRNKP